MTPEPTPPNDNRDEPEPYAPPTVTDVDTTHGPAETAAAVLAPVPS